MALLCLSSSVYSVQTAAEMNERTEFFSAVNANEQEALDALCSSGYEGIVACHEPSRILPSNKFQLVTLEGARKHAESEQDIILLFPPKYLLLSCIQQYSSDKKKVRVVLETSSYTSMVESVVKAIDFLGDKDKYIQSVRRIFGRNPVRKLSDRLFYVIELGYYKKDFFEVQWAHDIHWDDLVLPKQAVDHNLLTSLKNCPGVKQVTRGKKNGCFPIHSTFDVQSLRVGYHSTQINPVDARRHLMHTLASIGGDQVQETQFRGFASWNNEDFRLAHADGLNITVIDISGLTEEHRTLLVETMTRLKICYYVPMRNKVFLPSSGDFMNQLRLALLHTDVCLPFGQKQGCFQLTHWKSPEVSSTNRCHTFLFQKSAVGGMTVVPLQVEFGLQSTALLDLQTSHDLTAHPICQDLVQRLEASNFSICYTRSGNSDLKVLAFDAPASYRQQIPMRIHIQQHYVQVAHRGGLPKVYQPNGLPVYNETDREHWEKVLNKGVSPLQRKSVLVPDANAPHSPVRCGQLREHSSTTSPSQPTVTVGLEDAPFIFCPFSTDSQSCIEDLILFLHKYELDKYHNTPIGKIEVDNLVWHTETELPHLNLKSSRNWRIFVFRILPEKEITLRQICKRGGNYVLIQGSTLKTLTFDYAVVGFVIPPGVSFQQLISHRDDVEIIGCCRIIDSSSHPEPEGTVTAIDTTAIANFPIWNAIECKDNGQNGENLPQDCPKRDPHSQNPISSNSDEEDAFSFGDAVFVDDCFGEPAVSKPDTDASLDKNFLPGQLAEQQGQSAAVFSAGAIIHTGSCGPLGGIDDNGTAPVETYTHLTKQNDSDETKTIPQPFPDEDKKSNHTLDGKGHLFNDPCKSRGKTSTCSASSQSPSVLSLLERNRSNALIPVSPSPEVSDDVVYVKGPDMREVQRDALNRSQIVGNLQKWTDTFANANVDVLVQNITFITDRFRAFLPQYLIALRSVSQSIPSPDAGVIHLRNYLLEAIGKGWTLENSSIIVNDQLFGLEEAILAVASYHCQTTIAAADETLFSTVKRVASSISMEDQEALFEGIKVQCHSCSKEEEISAFTHSTPIAVDTILQCSAAELFQGVEPIFDASDYFANTPHDPSCSTANKLTVTPLGVGAVRIVRIDQPINSTHILDVLKWARASIDDSPQENDVSVTGLFCQCVSKGTFALLEADGTQLSMYTGTNLYEDIGTNQLQNMIIIGIVLQKKSTVKRFVHKTRKLVIKKPSRKLKKHKSAQKPFDPLSYTIRRSSGKRSTTNGMSRAIGKLTENQANLQYVHKDACSATESFADQDAAKVDRQPVTCCAATLSTSTKVPRFPDISQGAHDRVASKDDGSSDQPASCQLERDSAQTTGRRSQNKSPPRSARSDSIPKKIRSPDFPVVQVGLVSLFDGVGSVLPTFISRLQAYPKVFIAAECEEELRQLVSAQTGLRRNGQWTKLEGGTYGIYVDDVKKLLFNDCFILKEAAVLGKGCKWIIVSGSPCQDLTYAGTLGGFFGIVGAKSVFFLVAQHVIWWFVMRFGSDGVRFLCENAGSMKTLHKDLILWCLGLPSDTTPESLMWDPSEVFTVKRARYFFRNIHTSHAIPSIDIFEHSDYKPLINLKGRRLPVGPFLRVRHELKRGMLQLSWLQYTPTCLLYDYAFFDGEANFRFMCNIQESSKIPQLPWKRLLPPLWASAWTTFLDAVAKNKPPAVKDQCVWHILPIFATGYNRLPFRLLTKEEVVLVSGLTEHMSTILSVSNYVSEATVRNICGNSFHPKLIGSALGSEQDLKSWIGTDIPYNQNTNIPSPSEIVAKFKQVRADLVSEFKKQKIGPANALAGAIANELPFPEILCSRPNDLHKDPSLASMEARVQPPEFFPVPIRVDKKEPRNTLVCSCCSDFLQLHSYDNVLAMIDLVGLPAVDPSAVIDFFFYQHDKVNHVAHLKAVREEITNGLWKVGRVGNLVTTVLSGAQRQIERIGLLCFIQNGVAGKFQYFGHKFPRWFVFCYIVIETQMLSLITVQWSPYPQGYSLQLDAVEEKWIVDGKHDIEWCAGVHAIGLSKMRCAQQVTLFSSHALTYSYTGCPFCGGASIVSHSFCPIHTNSHTPQVKAIGLLEDSGTLSIAVANCPPCSQSDLVDCEADAKVTGPPATGAPDISSPGLRDGGLQSEVLSKLNDNALVLFIVLVAHASEQTEQWFNEGSLRTFLCQSGSLGKVLQNEKYRVTGEDWKTFVNVFNLKETGIRDEVAILYVWGTCALWKKINVVRPPEA